MRDLMKLKESEKSELERMTLNKSDMLGGMGNDNHHLHSKSKASWSTL